MNIVHLGDCMEAMREMPDNAYELAIADPPYGIGAGKGTEVLISSPKWKGGTQPNADTIYGEWDNARPDMLYFHELQRVSENQIIWGGNYFDLPPSPCMIVWDKENGNSFFADGEIAWTSFTSKLRIFKYLSCGFMGSHKNRDKRIHPTQKPIALYKWLLQNYAKPGNKILDTHVGSGSSRIAAWDCGFDFVGYEIDKDYWQAQEDRFNAHKSQDELFDKAEMFVNKPDLTGGAV